MGVPQSKDQGRKKIENKQRDSNNKNLVVVSENLTNLGHPNENYEKIEKNLFKQSAFSPKPVLEKNINLDIHSPNTNWKNKEGRRESNPKIAQENNNNNQNMHLTVSFINKAFVLKGLNQFDGALDCFQKAIESDPNNPKVYFCKANLYYDMNLYKEAIQLYDKTIELEPKNLFAYYKKAECYKQLKKFKDSINCYEIASGINPWDFYTFYNKGILHYQLKEYNLALECFNKAIKISPDNQYAYYNKAKTLKQLDQIHDSISAYNYAISLDPNNSSFLNNKGIVLKMLKHYDEAIECFNRAKELNPEDTTIYNNLGNTYCEMEKYDQALEYYDISIRMNNHDPMIFNNKAFVLYKLNRPVEALECYDQAIAINPNEPIFSKNKMNMLEEVESMDLDTTNKKKLIKQPTSKSIVNTEHLTVIKKLSQGSLGRLLLGEFKAKKVLIKKFIINDNHKEELYKIFMKEASSVISLVHPNLVTFIGCCKDREDDLCLISNYCSEGNLHTILQDKSIELCMKTKFKILIDISKGLYFLHNQRKPTIYKDLRSCNVLLDKQNDEIIAKLADFDLTGFVNSNIGNKIDPIYWYSPETMKTEYISLASDIYAFGILMWEVFSRQVPYKEIQDQFKIICHVKKGGRPNLDEIDKSTPLEGIELMKKCWDEDKDNRPTVKEISSILTKINEELIVE